MTNWTGLLSGNWTLTSILDDECVIVNLSSDVVHYGDELAAKIRENTEDFSKLSDFDKFVLNNGHRYKTREELHAGYDRHWKAAHDILVTMEEFLIEADKKQSDLAADTYKALIALVMVKELDEILRLNGSAIVECSHGVLTDAETGLKPHVSAIRTLPKYTCKMLRNSGYFGKVINLAVHRAYGVRHGAGPMPTYDPVFTSKMLPGSHKDENRWQGIVRAGSLDLNLIRHAISVADETPFDGICLTWFDQILKTGRVWSICEGYQNFPSPNESYTEFLQHAKPIISEYRIKNPILKADLFDFVGEMLNERLGVPLSILSTGSTEVDKIFSKII